MIFNHEVIFVLSTFRTLKPGEPREALWLGHPSAPGPEQ